MGTAASFKRTASATSSTISPAMRAWWKCNTAIDLAFDSTGNTLFDSGPYGLHVSPNFAPAFRPNTIHANALTVRPTVPNGFVYEVTAGGGTVAGTEPSWPTTPGNTVVSGGVTFTCRTPFLDTVAGARAKTDWITLRADRGECSYPRQFAAFQDIIDVPPVKGNVNYTANTISGTSATRLISDSASGIPSGFAAGEWVQIGQAGQANGFTGDLTNNIVAPISAYAANQLTLVSPYTINADDAAGESVTLTRVLPPMSIVVSAWINKINAATGPNMVCWQEYFGNLAGIQIDFATTHQPRMDCVSGTGVSLGINALSAISTAVDTHVVWVYNRGDPGTTGGIFYVFVNGVRTTASNLNKQFLNVLRSAARSTCGLQVFRSGGSAGTTFKDIQVYAYPGAAPSNLFTNGTSTYAQQLMAGTPLTPDQWS